MITPFLIQVVFRLAAVVAVVAGLGPMLSGRAGGGRWRGASRCVGGPLVARIDRALLILVFRTNDSLADIRAELRGRPSGLAGRLDAGGWVPRG